MLRTPNIWMAADPLAASGTGLRAAAYPLPWRIVAAVLLVISGASVPVLLALVLLATDPPVTPPVLLRIFAVFAVIPAVAAWLVRRSFAVAVEVDGEALIVRRRDMRIEIPHSAITRIAPWTVPLPGVGLSIWMRSGRRFTYGIAAADPAAILTALAATRTAAAAGAALQHPHIRYAAARARHRRRWYALIGKFAGFGLLPTAVLFNAHQHIAYGGVLGEYYLLGLASYLKTFAVYWSTVTIYLILYAGLWRGLAEGAALLAAWAAPARGERVRRLAELVCQILYYGGVPVVLLIRFWP
jgi:hypothetical protein